jgi:general L-amino acid transport system permease protein
MIPGPWPYASSVAGTAAVRVARPAFWRDVRVLRILGQLVFVVALVVVAYQLWLNLRFEIQRQGLDLSFDFLERRAGFSIQEGISYSANQSFLRAYVVGVANTLRVAGVGILLATVLGLVVGVARLSPNWLVRKIAQAYVEAIRNTPVLIQIIFWWGAVFLTLPAIGGGFSLANAVFLSNRGAAIPWVHFGSDFGAWSLFLLAGAVAAVGTWWWRTRLNEKTGRPHHRLMWALAVFILIASGGYVLLPQPLALDVPTFTGRTYRGGLQLTVGYAAILVGLVVYTAAFIGEIVRGSILAVSKGQKEAAESLGLTRFQQLRFVVLPQAMRIAIPPVNSQYLNLTKNSSLALAIGYPDLVSVSRTIMNQSGRATQMLLIIMTTFLVMSLSISFFMNLLNRAVTRRGER